MLMWHVGVPIGAEVAADAASKAALEDAHAGVASEAFILLARRMLLLTWQLCVSLQVLRWHPEPTLKPDGFCSFTR